ncbi:MAG: rubrerythrin family protein [Ruminococcus sp.]|nr:rubrerythrin family protein [Ruminococcus sp.]
MAKELCDSETRKNLMRAMAGEALTCARYAAAEKSCRTAQLFVLANLFKFTSAQEKTHGEVFAGHLKKCGCRHVDIEGGFPAETSDEPLELLKHSAEHEAKESREVYPAFAETARNEGLADIARDFENIAGIEDLHGDRFRRFGELMEQGRLFRSETEEEWLCLNCGYIHRGTEAPSPCPVCAQPQGWYIRLAESSWMLRVKGEPQC